MATQTRHNAMRCARSAGQCQSILTSLDHCLCELDLCCLYPLASTHISTVPRMGFKTFFASRREKRAAAKATKQARNDNQRQAESLLRIAMKRHTSLNSLTPRDPKQAHLDRQTRLRAEAEAEAEAQRHADVETSKVFEQEFEFARQDSVADEQLTADRGELSPVASFERRAMTAMGTASCLDGVVASEAD